MKKFILVLFMIWGFCLILSSQNSTVDLNEEQFYSAFSKILNSADNYFADITSDTKIQTRFGEEQKVNVDFPGANVTSYFSGEYEDAYGFYWVDYITVFYFSGNDFSLSSAYHNFIKNCLTTIEKNEKFGKWILDETITENNGMKKSIIEMTNDDYPDLFIYLDSRISETEQDITLYFEQEDWDF